MPTPTKNLTNMPAEKWNRPNTTIAGEYGCSHTLVSRIRKRLGVPPYIRKERIDWDAHDELFRSEMTDTRIAEIIGCDRSSVTDKRKKMPKPKPEQPQTPSKDTAPGTMINRIICGNRIGRTEIEEAIQILSGIQRSRGMSDPLFLKIANALKEALNKMALAGSGRKTPLPPVSLETGDKGTLEMKKVFNIPKNVKTRNAINKIIREHVSGGEILMDALAKCYQVRGSIEQTDPEINEMIEILQFARDKMTDVIMDFVRQKDGK